MKGAWAVHAGRLGKVVAVYDYGTYATTDSKVKATLLYADGGAMSGRLRAAVLEAARPAQVQPWTFL